jgi:hypothetical protein
MGQRPDEIGGYRRPGRRETETHSVRGPRTFSPVSDSDSPDDIQRDIEETRDRLSETIDAIQDKLSPDKLRTQATDAVREATIGRAEGAMNTMVNRV